jgi:hypothetical protein
LWLDGLEPEGTHGALPAWRAEGFGAPDRAVAFLGSGREALAYLLASLGVARGRVLLPAYGCAALGEAVAAAGADPAYYPVADDLAPDWTALLAAARDPAVRAAVVVHPFGRLLEPAVRLPVPVVEDVSHTVANAPGARAWGPPWSAGAAGSLRKLLPVSAGVALRWDGGTLPPPPATASPAARAHADARARALALPPSVRRQAELAAAEDLLPPDPAVPWGAPPAEALERLAALRTGSEEAAETWRRRTRTNWQTLAEGLRDHPTVRPLWTDLPAGAVPLGFVVRHPDRTRLAWRLAAAGIVPTWHWPVPPPARPFLGPAGRRLAASLLTLPCDGRWGTEDMERLLQVLRAAG